MSERWGTCRFCNGKGVRVKTHTQAREECGLCNGEGYDGGIFWFEDSGKRDPLSLEPVKTGKDPLEQAILAFERLMRL